MHPGRSRDIVKDKMASVLRADEVADQLAEIIKKEVNAFDCDDDPAEFIYLTIHTMGNLLAKICMSLEGYGHTYGIPNLKIKDIEAWIKLITKQNITLKTPVIKRKK